MTTKRMYGEKTKRRTYTVTDEVIKSLGDIGNGNRSKGLRICSGYHGRLVEALSDSLFKMESDLEQIEGEWGTGRSLETLERENDLTEEIIDARALLTEIAEAGK